MKMKAIKQPKPCEFCGQTFTPRNLSNKFCSVECREQAKMIPETRTCTVCYEQYEAAKGSNSTRCPTCRKRRHVTSEIGVRKTKKCKFTPTTDNTPDGAKPEDMWLGEIPQPQEPKPVKAKPKGRKLPKAPYPPAHVRERPLHVPNVKEYQIKPSRCAYTPEQDEIIRVMYDEGATWDEIGQEFGRTGDAVRRHAQVIFGGTLNRRRKNESM